jgi:hypothetical protein
MTKPERNPLNLSLPQLRAILAAADDEAGHHVLWFDEADDVHLDGPFSSAERGAWIEANARRIVMREETFIEGNGYCGREAAKTASHVQWLFDSLTRAWATCDLSERNFVIGTL